MSWTRMDESICEAGSMRKELLALGVEQGISHEGALY